MAYLRTVLCATDFFDCSRYAFRLARSLAKEQKARLVIAHVIPNLGSMVAYQDALDTLQPEDAHERFWKVLHRHHVPDPTMDVERRIVSGDPAREIVHLANELRCDLIVMGTHGRSGLGKLMMGSVAAEVLKKAPCPVVMVTTPRLTASHDSTDEIRSAAAEDGLAVRGTQ